MNETPEYQERIVAFIDILGFGALVKSLESNKALHELLFLSLNQIKSFKEQSEIHGTATSEFEVSCFSDSIVMSTNEYGLSSIVWACGWLQIQLLSNGILTRGGISKGKTLHAKDILYGVGMLNAYQIESKVAIYPRIVLDPHPTFQVCKDDSNFSLGFFKEDTDGLNYIDPFSFPGVIGHSCPAVCEMAGCKSIESKLGCRSKGILDDLKQHIEKAILQEKHAGHLAKWKWLKTKYDEAQKEYSKRKKKKPKKK